MDIESELEVYCSMHNDELSEAVGLLIELSRYDYCFLNDKTIEAVKAEMAAQLKNYKENTVIKEREVTEIRTITELEWTD